MTDTSHMAPPNKTSRAAWLPFALCLALTAAATAFVARAERQAEAARFASAVVATEGRITERLASYTGVLRAASGLLSMSGPVGAEDFRAFVERLSLDEHYPGTQGIGYTARFGVSDVSEATSRAHASGWTNVRVWPDTPRDEVHAIVMLEPLDARNRAALGYDMRTEPVRREAMDVARDTGRTTLSGKVTLVQEIEGERQAGFLLYAPVYEGGRTPLAVEERRAKLKGYVYAPLRAGDLFEGIFGKERPPVAVDIHDGPELRDDGRLYELGRPIAPREEAAVETISVAGHVWTARFARAAPAPAVLPLTAAVAALGALLSAVVLLTTRARERARVREVRAVASAMASDELLRMKDLFLGIVGHDLRSPLNAVSLSTQLLARKAKGDEDTTEALERIRVSTGRMARMVEQLLDLTRTRLGGGLRVAPRRVGLEAVVRDVVDEVARAHPASRIEVGTTGDLDGLWDPDRLAQVFSNLVGNAVRYPVGGTVRVELDGNAPERVVARVQNAEVMPAPLLPTAFEPFCSGAPPRTGAGLGLGLFITRAIAQAHGGTVEVRSREGEGTTFILALPRGAKAEPRPARRALLVAA